MIDNLMPDIPRIYTALAEWMACMLFIVLLKKRFEWWKSGLIMAGMLVLQSVFLVATGNVPIYFWIPCMIAAVSLMVGFIYFCCDVNFQDAGYFGMIAFVVAEFMASLEWQIVCTVWTNELPGRVTKIIMLAAVYGAVFFLLWKLLQQHLPKDGKLNISFKEYFSAAVIVIAVFAVSNLSFVSNADTFANGYALEIGHVRTIVDLGGIAVLYAHLIQCGELRVRRELEAVQNVLQNQYVQYKQSRESIDLINYKYHDLKHQIAVLRSETDPEKRNEFLNHMEDEIKQYEAQNKTGNKVLDTVLTSKSLYCAKHGITFTCVADGTLLDFMDIMDICSIFGNALDNAIECELKIADKEKRLIHVTVSQQKNFLILRFENYYEGSLKVKEGRFLTTKKEKEFHGYGIKSIRYTVNKYDGAVSIDTKENWFDLKILIPMKKTASDEVQNG